MISYSLTFSSLTFSSSTFSSSTFSSSTSYSLRHSCYVTRRHSHSLKHIDILLNDIILVTSYCTSSHRCSCHSESCANHATKLAVVLADSY